MSGRTQARDMRSVLMNRRAIKKLLHAWVYLIHRHRDHDAAAEVWAAYRRIVGLRVGRDGACYGHSIRSQCCGRYR